ncbi:MAG: hypothetical protein P1U89_18830 [Verrucomicrobiales bacterium]|nr:hypothetical protein [Verrucomicrobiales bacterium]
MTDSLRLLTPKGTQLFRTYVESLHSNPFAEVPIHLLTDARASELLKDDCHLPSGPFESKFEFAKSLSEALGDFKIEDLSEEKSEGMWNWLALFYFDILSPHDDKGKRKATEINRFLLSRDWKRKSRHLVSSVVGAYQMHGQVSEVVLSSAPSIGSEIVNQLSGSQEFWTNRGLIKYVHLLYWDIENNCVKKGVTPREKPGTIRRLVEILHQLERTYDLYSLDLDDFKIIAPAEFRRWL